MMLERKGIPVLLSCQLLAEAARDPDSCGAGHGCREVILQQTGLLGCPPRSTPAVCPGGF